VIVVGTHYGRVVACDWKTDVKIFRRQYFATTEIAYVDGLAIDSVRDVLWIAAVGRAFGVDANSGEPSPMLQLGVADSAQSVACSIDGALLAVGAAKGTHVYLLSGSTPLVAQRLDSRFAFARVVTFSPDSRILAILAGTSGPSVARLYDTASFNLIGEIEDEDRDQFPWYPLMPACDRVMEWSITHLGLPHSEDTSGSGSGPR
jgi:hypothetical protein